MSPYIFNTIGNFSISTVKWELFNPQKQKTELENELKELTGSSC
jgi:hypothetical protein